MSDKPLFIIKRNLQKTMQTGLTFQDQLDDSYLKDICQKITGRSDYDCQYVENDYSDMFLPNTYNKGRLATLRYRDYVHFITFSEQAIEGRNSSIQSVPTAFNIFYMCPYDKKKLYYYFICKSGNPATDYHMFIYRLMETVGFTFLNFPVPSPVTSFVTIEDMMRARDENRGTNKSNNSTYISKNENGEYEAYCKTYGASKYESSLICYAMSMIIGHTEKIKLYEILEGDLKELPSSSLQVLRKMDTVDIIKTDLTFEKRIFEESRGNQLRSPSYQYNLLNKLGEKHCALCGCTIPDIIQGAHIWPVANIRSANSISIDDKVRFATDGDNGLWLCENHHKLFDRNIIAILSDGTVKYNNRLSPVHVPYLHALTENTQLPPIYLNDNFKRYVELRNRALNTASYVGF
ncbi:MAG: HNH endonuclease [Candidatus Riflebacteria bacterium]|jgi:hypothetical protein|nr:HNH endonuclease [Candidatus Riflebacteria bacterium]